MTPIFTRRNTITATAITTLGVASAALMAAAPANAAAPSITASTQACEGELVGATWDLAVPAASYPNAPLITAYAYDDAYTREDITNSITFTTAIDDDGTLLLSMHGLPNDAASYGALVVFPDGTLLSVAGDRAADCSATVVAPPVESAAPAAPDVPADAVAPAAPAPVAAPVAPAAVDSTPATTAPESAAPGRTLADTGAETVVPAIAGLVGLIAGAALLMRQRGALRQR